MLPFVLYPTDIQSRDVHGRSGTVHSIHIHPAENDRMASGVLSEVNAHMFKCL